MRRINTSYQRQNVKEGLETKLSSETPESATDTRHATTRLRTGCPSRAQVESRSPRATTFVIKLRMVEPLFVVELARCVMTHLSLAICFQLLWTNAKQNPRAVGVTTSLHRPCGLVFSTQLVCSVCVESVNTRTLQFRRDVGRSNSVQLVFECVCIRAVIETDHTSRLTVQDYSFKFDTAAEREVCLHLPSLQCTPPSPQSGHPHRLSGTGHLLPREETTFLQMRQTVGRHNPAGRKEINGVATERNQRCGPKRCTDPADPRAPNDPRQRLCRSARQRRMVPKRFFYNKIPIGSERETGTL